MKKTTFECITLIYLILLTPSVKAAEISIHKPSPLCALLKNKKKPVAYLLDAKGNISQGPIDFGRFGFTNYPKEDYLYIPTQYRMVFFPSNRMIERTISPTGSDYLEFKLVKSVCPNTKTYALDFHKRLYQSYFIDRKWLPIKGNMDYMPTITMDDFSSGEVVAEIVVDHKFNNNIIGEIYDTKKK